MASKKDVPIYAAAYCKRCAKLLQARVSKPWVVTVLRCPKCQQLLDVLNHHSDRFRGSLAGLTYIKGWG